MLGTVNCRRVKMRNRVPAHRDPVLRFGALRFVALREGGRIEETIATENGKEMLVRVPAHVQPAHAALCCWSTAYSPLPARPSTGLMAPAWCPSLCIYG